MKTIRRLRLPAPVGMLALFAAGAAALPAQPDVVPAKLPEYTVLRAATPPVIDGKLDEAAWAAAPAIRDFVFPWWKEGKKEPTVAKLLWDDEHLYVAFICQDAHITARHTARDGKIPEDDCVEIMLTPDADRPHVYFNVEFNVIGGILDNFRPDGPDKPRAPKWDAEGLKLAGTHDGTLNDDRDTDRSWQVEVAIPWRNFAAHMKSLPPRAGAVMRANLNRHGGATNPQYSQWSHGGTPKPAFHTPDRFGRLTLSDRTSAPPAAR